MKLAKQVLGILVFATAQIVSLGAVWEGTDDFSGTLGQWDSTYQHLGQSSDGFFVNGGRLQFIKTVTTTNYQSSGALIWKANLPFNTNWTVMVDAHLNPISIKSWNPIDQDIRAALYVFENIATVSEPYYKRLDSVLQNGTSTNDEIRAVGLNAEPVAAGTWDFTLGLSFDSSTKTGTSFYFPTNQPSQLAILTNVNMASWTNMQIAVYGLSEYWAVGYGEDWLDNFKVYGTPSATASIAKAVRPAFKNLALERNYQLQVSADMNTWTNQGEPFTATNFNMIYPQYWDVDNWGKLFFRLQLVP